MKNIFLVGPLPPPYNGQSVSFSYLINLKDKNLELTFFDTSKYRLNFLNFLNSLCYLPIKILFNKYDKIYFIGSRSSLGFLRQLPFLLAANFKKIVIINHLHGADFNSFFQSSSFLLKPVIRSIYNKINTSIVLLNEMKKEFIQIDKMNIISIPNAFDEGFKTLKIDYPKQKNILYCSNLMKSKGITDFIKASELLLNNDNNVNINIAGNFLSDHICKSNDLEKEFFLIYDKLKNKFSKRINFHGLVTGREKVELFKKSSIFVLPTYYPTEAFPISILEAMASGNAIVTTKHNYLQNIIDEKNGILINPKDINKLFEEIKKLLSDELYLINIQKYNYNYSNKNLNLEIFLNRMKTILN